MWKIIRTMLTPSAIDQCSHYILILLADINLLVHRASSVEGSLLICITLYFAVINASLSINPYTSCLHEF